jgi:hypothetical protein
MSLQIFTHLKIEMFWTCASYEFGFFWGRSPNTKIGVCVKTTLKPTCFLFVFKWNEFIKCFYNSYYYQFRIVVLVIGTPYGWLIYGCIKQLIMTRVLEHSHLLTSLAWYIAFNPQRPLLPPHVIKAKRVEKGFGWIKNVNFWVSLTLT